MIIPTTVRNAVAGLVREADAPEHVGLLLLPDAPSEETGSFLKEPLKAVAQNTVPRIGRLGGFPSNETKYEEDSFKCFKYGLSTDIADDDLARIEEKYQVNLLTNEIKIKQDELLSGHDDRVATKLLAAGFNTVNRKGRYDSADADPLGDIRAGKAWGRARRVKFDTIVMNSGLYDLIATLVEKVRLTQSGRVTAVTEADVKQFLDIENLVIFASEYDTAGKGKAANLQAIWPTDKLLLCKKGVPDTISPSGTGIGRTYRWQNAPGGALVNFKFINNEKEHSTTIQVWHHTDEKVVSLNAGYMIDKCVSNVG